MYDACAHVTVAVDQAGDGDDDLYGEETVAVDQDRVFSNCSTVIVAAAALKPVTLVHDYNRHRPSQSLAEYSAQSAVSGSDRPPSD